MRLMNLFLMLKDGDACEEVPVMLNPNNVSFVEEALPVKWCPAPCVAVSLSIDNAAELRIKGTMVEFTTEWSASMWSAK